MIPRTGSCASPPPGEPARRQVMGAVEPPSTALYSPAFSPEGPSGLPEFSTRTAITLSWPALTAPAGKVNAWAWAPAAEPDPRNAPFSQTEYAPVGEMPSAVSVTAVAVPAAVLCLPGGRPPEPPKCPRYHTKPWSYP